MKVRSFLFARTGSLAIFGVLSLLAVGAVCPSVAQTAKADTVTSGSSVLGVGLTAAPTMEIEPSATGLTTSTATSTLSVATTNIEKFSVTISTADGAANTLTGKYPGNMATVNAVSGTPTLANMTANTWGYALTSAAYNSATTFAAVPTTSTVALADVVPASMAQTTHNYNLIFGTAVDMSLPTDTYKNEITVSVIATPVVIVFEGITTMQEMTQSICTNAEIGHTKQLIDVRDNKKYWVAKLADENCWMTQNLDLNLDATTLPLTSTTSDVTSDWNPGSTYYTSSTITSQTSNSTAYYSWDVGQVVYNQPNRYNSDSSYCSTQSNSASAFLTNCKDYVTDVSSMADDYKATQSSDTDYTWSAVSGNSYDAHYTIGNYYQWYAATAGSGASATSTGAEAAQSICPKGWKLPLSYSSNNTGDSFYNLLSKYTSPSGSGNLTSGSAVNVAALAAPGLYDASPYLFRAGYVNSGTVRYVGGNGNYWSSIAGGSAYAYSLNFSNTYINPSHYDRRYLGYSVRCML